MGKNWEPLAQASNFARLKKFQNRFLRTNRILSLAQALGS